MPAFCPGYFCPGDSLALPHLGYPDYSHVEMYNAVTFGEGKRPGSPN